MDIKNNVKIVLGGLQGLHIKMILLFKCLVPSYWEYGNFSLPNISPSWLVSGLLIIINYCNFLLQFTSLFNLRCSVSMDATPWDWLTSVSTCRLKLLTIFAKIKVKNFTWAIIDEISTCNSVVTMPRYFWQSTSRIFMDNGMDIPFSIFKVRMQILQASPFITILLYLKKMSCLLTNICRFWHFCVIANF